MGMWEVARQRLSSRPELREAAAGEVLEGAALKAGVAVELVADVQV